MPLPPRFSPAAYRVLHRLASTPSRWVHGYTLMTELDLRSGTLYPLLMRLADAGWLETRWDLPARGGDRPRHLYRLAPGAAAAARRLLRVWAGRRDRALVPRPAT